ncbi:MAG: DUF3822 family protein [Bacteroidia bacterium]|nr:DUF3822 family protein [Bacteroidia bacterium]
MSSPDHILPAINRVDALFKETDLENYYLSVQIGEKSFSYCILDSISNKYIGVGEFRLPVTKGPGEQEIRLPFDSFFAKVVASLPILRKKFKSCKVIWEGSKNTLVPEQLFEEKGQEKILSFNIPLDQQDKVLHDRLTNFRIVNVYAVPEKANEVLTRTFGVDHLPHLSSVLIESIYQNFRGQLVRPKVFLHIREHLFDLVVMDQFKLYYANTFEFRRPEDLVYFTIFALEQLGFSQEQAEVVLMGKITRNAPLYNLIFKYLRRVEFAKRNPGNEYSFIFNEIPHHAYYPLLNLNQCGL